MIDEYVLIYYYAFYGIVDKFNELYKKYINLKDDPESYIELIKELDNESLLTLCVERGCQHYIGFAKYIYNSEIEIPDRILQAISNRYAMSNIFEHSLFEKKFPFRIWYPDCPSEEMLNYLETKNNDIVRCCKYIHKLIKVSPDPEKEYYLEMLRKYSFNDNRSEEYYLPKKINPYDQKIIKNNEKYNVNRDIVTRYYINLFYSNRYRISTFINTNDICKREDLNIYILEPSWDFHDLDSYFDDAEFELKFLNLALNNDFFVMSNFNKFDLKDIKNNTFYAALVYNSLDKYKDICVSKFVEVGYFNYNDMIKYSIFDFTSSYLLSEQYYNHLLENLPEKFKYNVCLASILSGIESTYFNNNFEPELQLIKAAVKTNNAKIINDQLQKAVANGCFYEYLDMENKKWNNPPNKKYIREIFESL